MFGLFITVTMVGCRGIGCRGVGSRVPIGGRMVDRGRMMYSSMEELGFCGNKGEESQDSECLKKWNILSYF